MTTKVAGYQKNLVFCACPSRRPYSTRGSRDRRGHKQGCLREQSLRIQVSWSATCPSPNAPSCGKRAMGFAGFIADRRIAF